MITRGENTDGNKQLAFEIRAEERQSWVSIAMVWIGSVICVPALMIGGMLGAGLSLGNCVLAILVGYAMICVFMSFHGDAWGATRVCQLRWPRPVPWVKRGPSTLSVRSWLSPASAGSVSRLPCAVRPFSSMFGDMTGIAVPVWLSSVVWGIIMLLTACFRFAGLKWLNKIAVPLLGIVLAYTLIDTLVGGRAAALGQHVPTAPMSFVSALSATVGSFVVAAAISGDYCRFAKSRADVIKSSIVGVVPAGLAILMIGAVLAICTGSYDISVVLASSGLPLVGLIALILATWTTNVSNAYSGGLSLSVLLGQDEKKSQLTTAISGIIGTVLAAVESSTPSRVSCLCCRPSCLR